jgi:uncharacterized protein YegL
MTESQTHFTLSSGLKRPLWLSRGARQLVIPVRDGSGSMRGTKARDAEEACGNLISILAAKSNMDAFETAVIDFGNDAEIVHPRCKATEIDGHVGKIGMKGWTNITAGLKLALDILDTSGATQSAGSDYLRPVIILFSDGRHNADEDPMETANRIKTIADLVTVGFGRDADEDMLRAIASSPSHFYSCANGSLFKELFVLYGKTLATTRRAGVNATHALSQISQSGNSEWKETKNASNNQ